MSCLSPHAQRSHFPSLTESVAPLHLRAVTKRGVHIPVASQDVMEFVGERLLQWPVSPRRVFERDVLGSPGTSPHGFPRLRVYRITPIRRSFTVRSPSRAISRHDHQKCGKFTLLMSGGDTFHAVCQALCSRCSPSYC